MERMVDFGGRGLSDEQLAKLQRGLALTAARMTEFQILEIADALHGMIRARRRQTEYHRVGVRA